MSVSWCPRALHVLFECRDDLAWATFRRRDEPLWREEVVEVFLAPVESPEVLKSGRGPASYIELEVNSLGALFDAEVHNPDGLRSTMSVDTAWDWPAIRWAAGRGRRRDDWWASLELPWRGLGFAAEPPGLWFANFYRVERPGGPGVANARDAADVDDEYTAWSPTLVNPPDFHRPERFGLLALDGVATLPAAGPATRALIPQRESPHGD